MKKIVHYINHAKPETFGMEMECGKTRKQVRFVTWDRTRVTCAECLANMKVKENNHATNTE